MAEVFGIVAPAIDLATGVIQLCTKYGEEVANARSDIKRIQTEVTNLSTILQRLQKLREGPEAHRLPTTRSIVTALEDGHSQLETLKSKLASSEQDSSLIWPFKRPSVEKKVQQLAQCRRILHEALQLDQTVAILDVGLRETLGRLPIAQGAAFDSHDEEHNPTCLANTRVELLQEIKEWIQNKKAKALFWLEGMAGTGKSTISRTLARSALASECLGASFFFKRGEGDRGDVSKFFTTIAAQLASRQPAIAPHIRAAIDSDPTILGKAIREQFEKLVKNPLSNISSEDYTDRTILIIVDALDECDHDKDIRLLIQLFSTSEEINHPQLKVFLTSRPELPIRLGFKSISTKYQSLVLHKVAGTTIEQDIQLFLSHEFDKIRTEYNKSMPEDALPEGWPRKKNIQALTQMAVPLFVFAATVCRFVSDRAVGVPRDQLNRVLAYQNWNNQLDATYLPVLDQVERDLKGDQIDEVWTRFRSIVGSIVNLAYPLPVSSLKFLLGFRRDAINATLRQLYSVLSIPPSRPKIRGVWPSDGPVRMFHLSFRDFLLDEKKRDKPFWIDEEKAHGWLAQRCQQVMKDFLQVDIDINWAHKPGMFNTEKGIRKINKSIQRDLSYACCYWIYHLERCHTRLSDTDTDSVHGFLTQHFLHWLAALGVMKKASQSLALLSKLRDLVDVENGRNTITFVNDACRYIRATTSLLNIAPLQVYSSGIIFAPDKSEVRTHFEEMIPRWISLKPKVEAKWSAQHQTLEGHRKGVHSVTFSPNGALIASASEDRTVRIWDTTTGRCQRTLEGHDKSVKLVTFSQKGEMLASASDDKTIRLWNTETGKSIHTLEGHDGRFLSVAFTHEDTNVTSVSDKGTVWLWGVARGDCCKELEDHTPITFSPDGTSTVLDMKDSTIRLWKEKRTCQQKPEDHGGGTESGPFSPTYMTEVASASHDRTVRLWDKKQGDYYRKLEGRCYQELKGHTEKVTSFAFSPDGTLMASASEDQTIRLWNTATGASQQRLRGHGGSVSWVTFSPDSKFIASASADKTIKLWEVKAEGCQETLQDHGGCINWVTFSPNGTAIASASDDNTIGLWDADSGNCRMKLGGHSDRVRLVAFSPDGGILASVSTDKTVRLWDTATGTWHRTLEDHNDHVSRVAFSPNSQVVATASDDKTVRLWDVETGTCQQTFKGHKNEVKWVTFSQDGKVLASASYDDTVRLWDVETGDFLRALEGHTMYVHSAVFSPDSKTVASASEDKTVRLWEAGTPEDATVRLWEAKTGGLKEKSLKGHTKPCKLVTFSPKAKVIASASADQTVRLWDTDAGTFLQEIKIGIETCSLSFNEEGTSILTDIGAIACNNGKLTKHGLGISEDRCWITRNGKRLLWLPSHVRPDKFAVRGPVVAMGNSLGKVVVMGFAGAISPSPTPEAEELSDDYYQEMQDCIVID